MPALIAKHPRLFRLFLFLALVALCQPPAFARAQSRPEAEVPAGFRMVDSAAGVELYRKDYPAGSPDFVQVLDLSLGAELRLVSGKITEQRSGKGAYQGNDARFRSKTVQAHYESVQSQEPRLFCAANGSFFYMPEYPTRLPFPLKIDGQMLTDGYAATQFADKKLILELWPGRANIQPLSGETLYQSSAPNILGGLSEEANKRATHYTGRTFVGVMDRNSDSAYETLLVFSSRTATQAHAAETLRSFGAQKVMMLDGGGSTQLTCRGKPLIASERLVPQAMAILSGDATSQAAAQAQQGLTLESLPASNLIHAAPETAGAAFANPTSATPTAASAPTSVPFNPADDRPAVILPGTTEMQPGSADSPPTLESQAPPASAESSTRPGSNTAESQRQPPADSLLADYLPRPATTSAELASASPAADSQPAAQAAAVLAPGEPIYDASDILSIPMFMLPVMVVIVAVIIRRQRLRFGS